MSFITALLLLNLGTISLYMGLIVFLYKFKNGRISDL